MNMCIEISSGLWSFMGLLAVLCSLVLAGVVGVGVAERRGARRERLRKVQCGCAVRVVARANGPAANGAEGPTLRS